MFTSSASRWATRCVTPRSPSRTELDFLHY
jgi:hypothetical protein